MAKLYKYIGAESIRLASANSPVGQEIRTQKDIKNWIQQTNQKPDNSGLFVVTFIVDSQEKLRIADRHSEHVACAGGDKVFSAGEMFLLSEKGKFEIVEISNQSTGFCPEPESWSSVAQVLDRIPLPHPDGFTMEFVFRRCPACSQLNIVKNQVFSCIVCNTELPAIWNCDC
jgi:hypothetical protein